MRSHNFEIDYQKLAKAIVEAQKNANESNKVSNEWMKFILTLSLWGIAVISFICSVLWFYQVLQSANDITNAPFDFNKWGVWFVKFAWCLILTFLGAISICTAKEISEEKDSNNISTMFSNVVAFWALVVALIAMMKGL